MQQSSYLFKPSFSQQRLWLIDQISPNAAQYNVPIACRIRGKLDIDALGKAINAVVERHEILRTVFIWQDGELLQRCFEHCEIPMRVQTPPPGCADREKEIRTFLLDEYRQTFNLGKGPLLRVGLLKLAESDFALSITLHHIISDGWSAGILIDEVSACYRHFALNQPLNLPENAIQYADFAEWQRDRLSGERLQKPIAYWREKLRHIQPLQLPTDRARKSEQSFRGAVRYFRLPPTALCALRALAGGEKQSLFAALLAAFQVLLSRYCGQEDVAVGFPVAGRDNPDVENLIGLFVNTLVLRSHIDAGESFRALLRRVGGDVLDAQAHQEVPFEKLVDELQPDRDLSRAPLFQVMFAYQSGNRSAWRLPGLEVAPLEVPVDTSKFDLTLSLEEADGAVGGALEYSTDLFDEETIERFISHYENLLAEIVADPDAPLSALQIISNAERETLLAQWGRGGQTFPVQETVQQIFERRAAQYPAHTAVVCGESKLSYAELNVAANRIAHYLRARMDLNACDPAQSRIGICLPRSVELVAAILGVLKAGAAYVALDPDYPRERLAFYVRDSGLRTLLTLAEQQPLFEDLAVGCICLDSGRDRIGSMPAENPQPISGPDSLAYIIYTSGSTGEPKGVMVPNRNIVRLFAATDHWFGFNPRDVWTLFHSVAFDFSVWEIWGALLHGGKLVVVPYYVSRSPEAFYDLVVAEGVTVLNQTPSAFSQFRRADAAVNTGRLSLRLVIFGGEALDLPALRPWFERHDENRPRLINMYGITETTVHVTCREIGRADTEAGTASLIGVPIPDLSLYVLDKNLNPVPVGVVGEIYVGGAGVARGYLNREETTRQRFIRNPFSADGNSRLYRSGDLARYRADGTLEYRGRADEQVKIRGFRIEPGEIEAALRRHPRVAQALVISGAGRLLAYLVPHSNTALATDELRAFLQETLPDYMIPAAFVALDAFPLTPNGKLDRKALPEPAGVRPLLENDYVAPANATEKALCDIWASVLDVDTVGTADNFFALGGDSLRGVQVIEQAKSAGIDLRLYDLFKCQTIGRLVALGRGGGEREWQPVAPFSLLAEADRARLPAGIVDAYPLTSMQAAMFYHMELAPDAGIYHCTGTSHLQIDSPFDAEAFRRAVQDTVERHDVFKTSFDLIGYSEPLQLVHETAQLPVVVEDISQLPEPEQEQVIRELLRREQKTPFDLSRPTLLRFFIHLRTARSFQFTITECHPIFDGWSYHSMIVEVFNRYAAVSGYRPYAEPPLAAVRFRDFIAMERRALASQEQQDYWRETLEGCTVLKLPRLQPQAPQPPRIKLVRVKLAAEVYSGLRQFMRTAGIPMKSIMLTSHLKVMSLVSGETDLLTGIPVNGRPEEIGGGRLYGLFLNTLPFRFRLEPGSWLQTARAVFERENQCLPFRRYPFAAIQKAFGTQPLIDEVLFNYLDFHVYEELEPGLNLKVLEPFAKDEVSEGTNFTLSVHFQHLTLTSNLKKNQIVIDIDYDANKLTGQQARDLAQYYQAVLSAMARDPRAQHQHIGFLPLDTYAQIVERWNSTANPALGGESLQELFEAEAARRPQAVAIRAGAETLSYRQLNREANRLAHCLIAKGVRHNDCVGVYLPRSIAFAVSVLAVVKAGGVYVPLDPEDPADRTAFMVSDTGARVILTRADLAGRLPDTGVEILDTEVARSDAPGREAENPPVAADRNSRVYVIYTSGSTGEPKGVEILQRGIIRLVRHAAYITLNEHKRILQLASVNFDAATLEIWGGLLNGAEIVVYPDELPSIDRLRELIAGRAVTTAFLTTSLFNTLVDEDPGCLRGLEQLLTGGEVISVPHVEKLQRTLPGLELIHAYGPTETTTFAITLAVNRPVAEYGGTIPIGRPIANTQAYILDRFLQPVPVGTPGELYLGGDGLARGYLNRSELNARQFIDSPFARGARLYRTGDRARYRPDGTIEYLGRLDGQIKIRGFRVEPGEIETALRTHGAVENAAVLVKAVAGEKHLVAYWTGAADRVADADLKRHLECRLPRYMVPAHYVWLEALPLRRSGKIDWRALPDPVREKRCRAAIALPESQVGKAVLALWKEVLKREDIGIDDNFFDLGGHSLLLTRLHLRLKQIGYRELSIIDLLNYPTVDSLARYIAARENREQGAGEAGENRVIAGRSRLAERQKQRQQAE